MQVPAHRLKAESSNQSAAGKHQEGRPQLRREHNILKHNILRALQPRIGGETVSRLRQECRDEAPAPRSTPALTLTPRPIVIGPQSECGRRALGFEAGEWNSSLACIFVCAATCRETRLYRPTCPLRLATDNACNGSLRAVCMNVPSPIKCVCADRKCEPYASECPKR